MDLFGPLQRLDLFVQGLVVKLPIALDQRLGYHVQRSPGMVCRPHALQHGANQLIVLVVLGMQLAELRVQWRV